MFKCEQCVKSFSSKDNLTRHIKIHVGARLTCDICPKTYCRNDNLTRHMKNNHVM